MRRDISQIELPDDVLAELPVNEMAQDLLLQNIGKALSEKRSDAIAFKKASGIEETWTLCEESYVGIDDLNRAEYTAGKWVKSPTLNGPITTPNGVVVNTANQDPRSTAFVRLTGRYVDAGAAKIGEILLQIDDKPFSFSPDPIPDLEAGLKDSSQVSVDGIPLTREPSAQEQFGQAGLQSPAAVPLTTRDLAKEALDARTDSAKKAEKRVYGWMLSGQHHREMRKVIFDAARIGVGVLKGPYPDHRRMVKIGKDRKVTTEIQIFPTSCWVDPWNIYPDPGCGENIRDGDYIFERVRVSEKQVRDLKGLPGYLDRQIEKVLKRKPSSAKVDGQNPNEHDTRFQYEMWHFHGTLKRSELVALNAGAGKDIPKDQNLVYAVVTMVDDTVIRGSINPLESGELPYHSVPWQRRSGFWAGIGVGEQIFVPQRITNAATRALLNNAGISAGPQIVITRELVTPANNDWTITPNKLWYAKNDGLFDDVRKAFVSFDVGNVGNQLMQIIEYGMKLAEESTSIPLITQGQSGGTQPETYGATQLQNNNANQLLRSIGYAFDYYITEPLVKMYYEYLLLDPDVPEDEKGNFTIDAHGSIAMIERSIQDQTIAQMTPLAQNPMFGVNPKKWFEVLAKSKRLDPRQFQYTDAEQQQLDSQPKPEAPAIAVAKIKAQVAQQQMQLDAKLAQEENTLALEIERLQIQSDQAIAKLTNATAQLRVKMDTDRDTVYVESEMKRAQADFQAAMETLRLKRELAAMEFAAKHNLNLENVKAKLADTTMRLQVQKQLAAMDNDIRIKEHTTPTASDLMKPPAQRPGKAANGKAFSQV
jgi:hypothetical protein